MNYKLAKAAIRMSHGLYKHKFNHLFNGRDRITITLSKDDWNKSPTYMKVDSYLSEFGYTVSDYLNGYCRKGNSKNQVKIGKLIKNKKLLEEFRDCPYRQNSTFIISRHPYDIITASYNRKWTSCMKYDGSSSTSYELFNMTKNPNTLICYHVKPSVGMKDPLGRIFIFEYIDYNTGLTILKCAGTSYGIFPKKYIEQIDNYLDINFNCYTQEKIEQFNITEIKFKFPEDCYQNLGDKVWHYMYNSKIMNNRSMVRRLIMSGDIVSFYKKISKSLSFIKVDNSVLIDELERYVDYFSIVEAKPRHYNRIKSLYLYLSNKDIEADELCAFFNLLNELKVKIKRSDNIEKNLIDLKGKVENRAFIQTVNQYSKCIDAIYNWGEGVKAVKDVFEKMTYNRPVKMYNEVIKAFG